MTADIITAIESELEAASRFHGVKFEHASVSVGGSNFCSVSYLGMLETDDTIAGAAHKIAKKLQRPDEIAAEKREKAAKLLAEADAIDGGAT